MAPPHLSASQINCGPDWPDAPAGGTCQSLRTPVGQYDLRTVLARLPVSEQPHIFVALVDASFRNLPRQVGAFRGPKVLLVADTHHMEQPLSRLLRYAASEPYDRVVLLYDRHHALFFREAGVKPLYWFPGLTFPLSDREVQGARQRQRSGEIAFVGQAGSFHPRRGRVLQALTEAQLPLKIAAVRQTAALQLYGSAAVGFNCSLNGDLNLRCFEILASGAALLTDRLADDAGLDHLWRPDRHFVAYDSIPEAVDRARDLLAKPAAAAALGRCGAAWFDQHFTSVHRQRMFRELVIDGKAPELFPLPEHRPLSLSASRLLQVVPAYEKLQELHRIEERVQVAAQEPVPELVGRLSATLPRVDVIVQPSASDAFCASVLGGSSEPTPTEALERGDYDQALRLARAELASDPKSIGSLVVMAEIALELRNVSLWDRLRSKLNALAPDDPRVRELAGLRQEETAARHCLRSLHGADVALASGDWEKAVLQAKGAARLQPNAVAPLAWLGRHHLERGDAEVAIAYWRGACQRAQNDPKVWLELGRSLLQLGKCADALCPLLRASLLDSSAAETQRLLAQCAHAVGHAPIAASAWKRLKELCPGEPETGELAIAAARLRSSGPAEPKDLLITHVEVNRLHGTGVLLQRFFPDAQGFVTLRSSTMYDGKVEFPGMHLALDLPFLPAAARLELLTQLLRPLPIRRILCVPFYGNDFGHALAAARICKAELCMYVMDDQTLYGSGVPRDLAQAAFQAARLRLTISPEMAAEYSEAFGLSFGLLPPIVGSLPAPATNYWSPDIRPGRHCAMVGNIWSARQFAQLRSFVRRSHLRVDWFGNANVPWLADLKAPAEADGIQCLGFLPEAELAKRLATYPFVVVPSGALDGTEDNEWLTRLSLPSRMVFILTATQTPIVVLGNPATAAARFVDLFGLGRTIPYDCAESAALIDDLLEPARRNAAVSAARHVSPAFVMPNCGEWIWQSLRAGRPAAAPFDAAWASAAAHRAIRAA